MTSDTNTAAPQSDTRPIVVGFDGSSPSDAALERGVVMARALSVPLRVIAVWQSPRTLGGYPMSGWTPEEDLRLMIDTAVVETFGAAAPAWFSAQTIEGTPAQVLIRESRDAQMLVVGSRGHGGFAGLLLGSVSSACAEHATCPVLVMHTAKLDPISAGAEALGDGSRSTDRSHTSAGSRASAG
jgi:nucleotide-binding universal stress UspA family protein